MCNAERGRPVPSRLIAISVRLVAASLSLFLLCGVNLAGGAETPQAAAPREAASSSTVETSFPPNPTVYLLRDPAIQAELKVTAAQRTALNEFTAQANEPLWQLREAKLDGLGADELRKAYVILAAKIQEVLHESQRDRLLQIVRQLQGTAIFSQPDFLRQLELTATQQQKITARLAAHETTMKELRTQAGAGKDVGDLNRRAKALQKDLGHDLLAGLSPAQRTRWNSLVGRPFDTARLLPLTALAPELRDVETWINSPPLQLKGLRGQVVIVHFYTFGCSNCIHNYPSYRNWIEKFRKRNVTILGIHTPETPGERDVSSIRKKAQESGLSFPIAVDGSLKNWQAWGNGMWPSVYVVDKRGYVRYWWYGELNWQGAGGEKYIAGKVEELLSEK